jgi:mannose-6-phosphate isomerase-like protein (cupin superfamily)
MILEGRMKATIDGKLSVLEPSDGLIIISRYQVHGFQAFKGERMILKEYTYPAGDYKEEQVLSSKRAKMRIAHIL